jgi:outer membrane protein
MKVRLIRYGAASNVLLLSLSLFVSVRETRGQCAGNVYSPGAAADCAARETPHEGPIVLDPAHSYTLPELIEIAEHHNPNTRIIWERAKQRAGELGLARSVYYPELEGLAVFGDQRLINPFPKPIAPRGYTLVEVPVVQPEVTLQYLIFDFGKRGATLDSARAEKLAAGADFIQVNQALAFRVASSYYLLVTAQERLQASQETLRTALSSRMV